MLKWNDLSKEMKKKGIKVMMFYQKPFEPIVEVVLNFFKSYQIRAICLIIQ